MSDLEFRVEKLERDLNSLSNLLGVFWICILVIAVWYGHQYAKEHQEPPKQAEVAK